MLIIQNLQTILFLNELPENVDVYFQDENYLEFIFEDGKYYSATIFGNGDFTHHQAEFEFIK